MGGVGIAVLSRDSACFGALELAAFGCFVLEIGVMSSLASFSIGMSCLF